MEVLEGGAGCKACYIKPSASYLDKAHLKLDDNSTMHQGANYRAYRFALLQNAIKTMVDLPVDANYRLDSETGKTASHLLALLENNYSVYAPRLLPHDEDILALTWDDSNYKTLLTVEEEEIDLIKINLHDKKQEFFDVADENGVDLNKLIESLSAKAKVATL